MKSKKGMKVDIDVQLAENITVAYLQSLLAEEQKDVAQFMHTFSIVHGEQLPEEWEQFFTKVNTIQNLLALLGGLMEDAEFKEFSKAFYNEIK